jgi:hypothetical protein
MAPGKAKLKFNYKFVPRVIFQPIAQIIEILRTRIMLRRKR